MSNETPSSKPPNSDVVEHEWHSRRVYRLGSDHLTRIFELLGRHFGEDVVATLECADGHAREFTTAAALTKHESVGPKRVDRVRFAVGENEEAPPYAWLELGPDETTSIELHCVAGRPNVTAFLDDFYKLLDQAQPWYRPLALVPAWIAGLLFSGFTAFGVVRKLLLAFPGSFEDEAAMFIPVIFITCFILGGAAVSTLWAAIFAPGAFRLRGSSRRRRMRDGARVLIVVLLFAASWWLLS